VNDGVAPLALSLAVAAAGRKYDDRNNYELQIENRTAILHLSSLRKFHPPDSDTDDGLNMTIIDAAGEDDEIDLLRFPDISDTTEEVGGRSLTTSTDADADDGTAPQETTRLCSLLGKFPEVFEERPGFTSVIEHKIVEKTKRQFSAAVSNTRKSNRGG